MAFGASFVASLFNAAFVNVTRFMMPRSVTLPTFTTTTMTALVDQIVYTSPTIQTTRRNQPILLNLQSSHLQSHLHAPVPVVTIAFPVSFLVSIVRGFTWQASSTHHCQRRLNHSQFYVRSSKRLLFPVLFLPTVFSQV